MSFNLVAAIKQMKLNARAFQLKLKLARTIPDLAGSARIKGPRLAEAIRYRRGEAG